MRYKKYVSYRSEISQLEEILSEIPDDRFIEKIGFESRLETARKAIEVSLRHLHRCTQKYFSVASLL